MGQVLQKALGCIFAIALGYVLKRLGFFQAKEKETIKKALLRNHGKRKKTAEELKISERTLYRKIKEYNLE